MTDKTSSFLKVISGIVVFISLFLCITINPSMEQAKSTLSELYKYNSVPYLDSTNSTGMTTTKIKNNDNYKSIDTYYGTITAYGPDCVGCSGVTASGHNVYEYVNGVRTPSNITYFDSEFGEVRILAAANSKFPFGSIIRITGDRIDGSITGIVLDTGGAMISAWNRGEILMDLLFASEI